MLLNFKELPMERQKVLFLQGLDYALAFSYQDYKDYQLYKEFKLEKMSELRELEMKTLEILDQLGFPMDEVGTYLYKNMVVRVAEEMKNINTRTQIRNSVDMLLQMKQPYSQFYLDVARNDLDIGIKTFHAYVQKALEKVDENKENESLIYQIYGNIENNIDYGEQAFILGSYIAGKYESTKKNKSVVKELKGLQKVALKENI